MKISKIVAISLFLCGFIILNNQAEAACDLQSDVGGVKTYSCTGTTAGFTGDNGVDHVYLESGATMTGSVTLKYFVFSTGPNDQRYYIAENATQTAGKIIIDTGTQWGNNHIFENRGTVSVTDATDYTVEWGGVGSVIENYGLIEKTVDGNTRSTVGISRAFTNFTLNNYEDGIIRLTNTTSNTSAAVYIGGTNGGPEPSNVTVNNQGTITGTRRAIQNIAAGTTINTSGEISITDGSTGDVTLYNGKTTGTFTINASSTSEISTDVSNGTAIQSLSKLLLTNEGTITGSVVATGTASSTIVMTSTSDFEGDLLLGSGDDTISLSLDNGDGVGTISCGGGTDNLSLYIEDEVHIAIDDIVGCENINISGTGTLVMRPGFSDSTNFTIEGVALEIDWQDTDPYDIEFENITFGAGASFSTSIEEGGLVRLIVNDTLTLDASAELYLVEGDDVDLINAQVFPLATFDTLVGTFSNVPEGNQDVDSDIFPRQTSATIWFAEYLVDSIRISTIENPNEPGVSFSFGTGTVSESGTTDTLTVVLDEQPVSDSLTITATTGGRLILSEDTFTFTDSDWDVPQTAIISVEDDTLELGTQSDTIDAVITFADPNSTDAFYASTTISQLTITILDIEQSSSKHKSQRKLPINQSQNTPVPVIQPATNLTPLVFARDLEIGAIGEDVLQLQKILNQKGFIVSVSGAGSIGNETTYFGPATQAALIKFQIANNITPSVGYFGPITKSYLNSDTATEAADSSSDDIFSKQYVIGQTGSDIVILQNALIQANKGAAAQDLAGVGATGYFGPLTQAALLEYLQ